MNASDAGTERPADFNLDGSIGNNDSERILMRLCRASFLTLWSYANPYTEEGRKAGKGVGTELVDVLVVFGDDVILFSDKHCALRTDIDIGVAWPRWFKAAVAKSLGQLQGALGSLQRRAAAVFLDPHCTRPLPIAVPRGPNVRYHLVAITRGSFEACRAHFGGGLGSHIVNTGVAGLQAHLATPFVIGRVDPSKPFVHVLDEFSIEALFREFDTVADFLGYLRDREAFLASGQLLVQAPGEEELIAAHVLNHAHGETGFLPPGDRAGLDGVFLDGSLYASLLERDEYAGRRRENRISYIVDRLIDRFATTGSSADSPLAIEGAPADTERGLRILASLDRFRRRLLGQAIGALMRESLDGEARTRMKVAYWDDEPNRVFVLMVVRQDPDEAYEAYRRRRARGLLNYLHCVQLRFPQASTIFGLAFDHPRRAIGQGGSEDMIVWLPPPMTPERRDELEALRAQLGILGDNLAVRRFRAQEFPGPLADQPREPSAKKNPREAKEVARKKRARKVERQSRRRNRRR